MRVPRKLKKQIPKGFYCYSWLRKPTNKRNVKHCPFHKVKKEDDEFIYYCDLIRKENKETIKEQEWDALLQDSCKQCSIKLGIK